jgi:YihY family inner membrane protein
MGFAARVDALQQRWSWVGLPIAVVYKFLDDQGGYLAALIAYYGFLSLFPLLLFAVTILGFVLHHDPRLQAKIVDSALSNFPIVGQQIRGDLHGYHGSVPALVFGLLGSLYGGLGVAQAGQNAMNQVWAVPRHNRPNPLRSRLRSLRLLLLIGGGVLVTTGLSALSSGAQELAHGLAGVGLGIKILSLAGSVLVNLALFVLAFRVLTVEPLSVRDVFVGAAVAAVLWQILQTLGTYYLLHKVSGSTEVYGTFGLVLGILAWIYFESLIVVFCAELNVVIRRGLWPRALLTPFTDDVVLTPADETVYDDLATTQSQKGFERIDVSFDDPPVDAGGSTEETS